MKASTSTGCLIKKPKALFSEGLPSLQLLLVAPGSCGWCTVSWGTVRKLYHGGEWV